MNDDVFEDVDNVNVNGNGNVNVNGRGMTFGTQTHEFAERYILDEDVDPSNDDERHIQSFVDSLDGKLRVEEDVYLPLTVDGEQINISGIVDLVHIRHSTVEIIDFKTDLGQHAEDEYQKQLSVYYHVLNEWFSDREVITQIFYTHESRCVDIDPLPLSTLAELVSDVQKKE